jgi:hypothetical protein
MSVIKGRRIGGKLWHVDPAVSTPPSQVGSFAPGTPAATTIPVSYTAATGTATITYAGYVSAHGANSWTLNGGTFTATGGTFTGLSPSTNYDLRIVATNGAGSSTTDYLTGASTSAAGTAPSHISNFAPGTPSTSAVAVSYTAASGTAPITYTGYTSLHGANSWAQNVGTFSATGGIFSALVPGTNYDLRIVAVNSYGSSITDYTAGVTTATPAPSTLTASRFDLVLDKSSGPVGTSGTATVYPNATWNGNGAKSITLSGTGISFPSGASAIIPSTGTTPITVPYSIGPGIGELSIVATNTGGLANPYPAPFNAFAASSGSAQTISGAAISVSKAGGTNLDLQPFQRDVPNGNPNGWATGFGKGWGEVFVTVNPGGATDGLFAKLIDADSSGATSTVGTGTYLQSSPVQVYGGLVAGSQTLRLQIPASNKRYYLELATNSAWANPVRVPQRFFVGIVLGFMGASQQAGMLRAYAYSSGESTGQSYTKVVTMLASFDGYATADYGTPYWFPHANQTTGPDQMYGEYSSSAVQEWGRMIEAQFGVLVANTGCAQLGVGMDGLLQQDGVPGPGVQVTLGLANNKFRYLWCNFANGFASNTYDPNAASANLISYANTHYPACAVFGFNYGGTGIFAMPGDGSRVNGYTRLGVAIAVAMAAGNPMVVSLDDYHWNDYYGGHASMSSRMQYARTGFRAFLDAELTAFGGNQTSARGPTLASTGTAASDSRVIRVPYKHHGGATLSAIAVNCSGTTFSYTNDVTPAELGSLFAVYGPGGYRGNGQAILITGAVINTSSPPSGYDGTIDVTLSGSSGVTYADNSTGAMPSGFNVQFAADFGASGAGGLSGGGGRCVVLLDNQADSVSGLAGRHVRPAVDIAVTVGAGAGGGGGGGGGTGGSLPTFAVQNWGAASSQGLVRVGMPFKKGDMPAGSIPALSNGATVQVDARSTWIDGSLKYGVAHIRDTAFAAGEARTYQLSAVTGSYNNIGTLTLAQAIAGHDFKVLFTSVSQYDGTNTTQRGSGSFTASLAAHAATATRVTKIHSGPICEGWVVWGMATNNSGGAADAHLKVYWYVDAWKNPDSSIYSIEVVPVIAQDWWSIASKYMLLYDAAFQDGGSAITTFPGVHHPYHSHWAMVKSAADNNIGRRPWVGGAIPTLSYQPNRAYWIGTNLVPPLDLSLSPGSIRSDLPTFVPCGNIDHRPAIDGTGAYMGRGLIPQSDAVAFMRQTPFDTAVARVNAHAGLHIPYHNRSNRQRTRPGESADTASTIIAQKLDNPNRAAGWDDCTADGMPTPVYAYFGYYTDSAMADGYVGAAGGWGVWSNQTNDASHAVAYSYFMYLLEGETYFLDATLDLAAFCTHQTPGGGSTPSAASGYGIRGLLLAGDSAYASLSIPTGIYAALPGIWKPSNGRAVGWSLNELGYTAISPDNRTETGYLKKWVAQIGDWVGASMQYMPASQKAAGQFFPKSWLDGIAGQGQTTPWFTGLGALGAYNCFGLTEDTRFRDMGDMFLGLPIGLIASGRTYVLDTYRITDRPKEADWAAGTNEYYPPGQVPVANLSGSINDAPNGWCDADMFEGGGQNQSGGWCALQNGDQVIISAFGTIPSQLTEGTVYYARDVRIDQQNYYTINAFFKLATTPGGTPITFSANTTHSAIQWTFRFQDSIHPVSVNPPYIIPPDSYAPMMTAAIEMGAQRGANSLLTPTILSASRAFMAPVPRADWMPWALKAP